MLGMKIFKMIKDTMITKNRKLAEGGEGNEDRGE